MKNICFMISILVAIVAPLSAYGDNAIVAEWHSEIRWGVLEPEKTQFNTELEIDTLSKEALQLSWKQPTVHGNIIGYKILKKAQGADYTLHEITRQNAIIDHRLKDGNYYSYKIIPIIQEKKTDFKTKHGIDRHNDLHKSYMDNQIIRAQQLLIQKCPKCGDESFMEIDDIKWYNYPELDKREDPKLQKNILKEIAKAEKTFLLLTTKQHYDLQ